MASSFMQQVGKKKLIGKRSLKKYLGEALCKNLLKDGGEDQTVREKLNQYIKSRKSAYKWEVGHTLKALRKRKLYGPALKLSETMEKRGMNKTVSDKAVHLDLVAKSSGITAAETYFINLPESEKTHHTYGALLHGYCKELMVEKAQGLFVKMKELNLELTALSFNSIMNLYSKCKMPQMVPALIQEMKARDVMLDIYSYNLWMRALAATGDVSGVERVIDEMKRDGRVAPDWTTYSNLASIYVKFGSFDKAEKALKELESKNSRKDLSAYQFLITLYGHTGNLVEVYRIWQSLKLAFPKTSNISYLNMIQVLVNLKDLPGAEKCFEEWSSSCSAYDIRIVNVLIGGYLKEGLAEKAEELKTQAQKKGARLNAKTYEFYIDYYMNKGNMSSAVDCLENAILLGRGNGDKFTLSQDTVMKMMQHFEVNKDVDGAERFLEVLKKSKDELESEILESLIRIYASTGKKNPAMQRRIKMEKAELSEEGLKLLNEICPEMTKEV